MWRVDGHKRAGRLQAMQRLAVYGRTLARDVSAATATVYI